MPVGVVVLVTVVLVTAVLVAVVEVLGPEILLLEMLEVVVARGGVLELAVVIGGTVLPWIAVAGLVLTIACEVVLWDAGAVGVVVVVAGVLDATSETVLFGVEPGSEVAGTGVFGLAGAVSGVFCACARRTDTHNAIVNATTSRPVRTTRLADGIAHGTTESAQKTELDAFRAPKGTKCVQNRQLCVAGVVSDPARNSVLPLQTTGECLVQSGG